MLELIIRFIKKDLERKNSCCGISERYIRDRWLFFSAAAATAIAGILHIILASNSMIFNPMVGVFFLISGILQLFWAYPTEGGGE